MIRKLVMLLLSVGPNLSAQADEVPFVGSMAPAFSLVDQSGRQVAQGSLRGKWLVLNLLSEERYAGLHRRSL